MKISKRDLILDSIISAYLDDNVPIGSNELCSRMQISIPASTIRVYFKKLSEEGAIRQLHVSGGRIPTVSIMQKYWRSKLKFDKKLKIEDLNNLSMIVQDFEIYCMVFTSNSEILKEVLNYNDRFIILVFGDDEIILKFNDKILNVLSNLVGITLEELEKITMQIGFMELRTKIAELKRSKIQFLANEVVAYKIFKDERFRILLDPTFAVKFNKNIIFSPEFDSGFMGVKRDINFIGKDAVMICAGSIYEDYEKFFNTIMEVA